MKMPLKDLEQFIEDEIIEQAEGLLTGGLLTEPAEVEKGLWSCLLNGDRTFEIEVKLVRDSIRAYSCDCQSYGKGKFCAHLTACFLALRQKRNKQIAARKEEPAVLPTPKRLTTNIILKEISAEELQEFVRDYAKNSRQFAIALKARFASSVSAMDRHEKYAQLLDTAIKTVKRPNKGINTQGIKQLVKLVEELQKQVSDTIERKNFQEAFAILTTIFEKVAVALRIAEGGKQLLLDTLTDNFPLLEDLLRSHPAPDLERDIWQFLVDSFRKGYLKWYQTDRHFLFLGKSLAHTSIRQEELIEAIEARFQDPYLEEDNQDFLLINQLDLYNAAGQGARATRFIQEHLKKPSILLMAIDMAQKRAQYREVGRLAKIGLALHNQADIAEQLEEILYQNALQLNKSAAIIKWAKKRFLSTYQKEYWTTLKEKAKKDWEKQAAEILKYLQQQTFSIEQRDTLAWIYHTEKKEEALFQFIQDTRSLELLMQYDQHICPKYQQEVALLYEDLLLEYLNQHLGRQASQKIRRVLLHLQDAGTEHLAQALTQKLRIEFSERHSLIEELSEF